MTKLVWALWIVSGGPVNSGYLVQPQAVAYFSSSQECQRVGDLVAQLAAPRRFYTPNFQCIQAEYVLVK